MLLRNYCFYKNYEFSLFSLKRTENIIYKQCNVSHSVKITNKHSEAVELSDRETEQAVDNAKQRSSNTALAENDAAKTPRELFEEFYSGVTLHGFRFLFEGNPVRRIVWLFITTGVFAFSIYLFYGLFKDFLQQKTITSLSKQFLDGEVVFPTVIVCPNNPHAANKTGPGSRVEADIFGLHYFEWGVINGEEEIKLVNRIEKELNVIDFMPYLRLSRMDKNDLLDSPV